MIRQRGLCQDITHDLDMLLLKIDQLDEKIMRKNQALCDEEVEAHQDKLHALFNQLAEVAQLFHHYTRALPLTAVPLQYRRVYTRSKKKQANQALSGNALQNRVVGK
ncbi:MAG: hypothetical protein ABF586_07030 [Sporolactobacillus sp.]